MKNNSPRSTTMPALGVPHSRLLLAVVALGVTCIITQIVILRESLAVFYGNELVIGIILGNWMILTGIGSYAGRLTQKLRERMDLVFAGLLLLAILPLVTVFLLRVLKNVAFPVGSMIGIVDILYGSFLLLMPYCLISGAAFTLLADVVSERRGENTIASVYAWEAIGSVIGGLLFSFVAVYLLTTFQSLLLVALFNIIVATLLTVSQGRGGARYVIPFVFFCILVPSLLIDLDRFSRQSLFIDQEIVYDKDTPYGSLVVTKQADQLNFYENSTLLCSANDVTTSEEAVHYAMIQHPHPRSVLLISGAISGSVQEILKYNVDRIDYVELNPWLIELARKYSLVLSDERVHIAALDARLFVRQSSQNYDVALVNVSEPSTAQLNRYYTVEFFNELRRRLNPGAVVSLGLLPASDYQGEAARRVTSVTFNTLQSVFQNVLIVPGLKTYYLASDSMLSITIARMIERRGLQNAYVNPYYIDDRILEQRGTLMEKSIDEEAGVNTDFAPASYYQYVTYWLSFFKSDYWVLAVVCLIALLVAALNVNVLSVGMFTGGFAASSVEILILIAFQIAYGYVYQIVGIIVTLFMAGLALGAFCSRKLFPLAEIRHYVTVQILIGVCCVLLPLWFVLLRESLPHPIIVHGVFFLLTLGTAGVIGIEFSLAARLRGGRIATVASELYSIDLMGSAIGALLVSAYFIPVFGISTVSLLVGILSVFSGTLLYMKRKNFVPFAVEGK